MTDDQLAAAITEASRPAASAARVTESAAAPDAAGPPGEPAKALHEMDWEAWEEHAAGVLAGPYGMGLVSPYWAGPGAAPVSPFRRGL